MNIFIKALLVPVAGVECCFLRSCTLLCSSLGQALSDNGN